MPRAVSKSAELMRIRDLPRRELGEDLSEQITDALRLPTGTMRLNHIQAQALKELYEYGGLFGPIAVGSGKTLITLLASAVCEAQRPLLLIPASLKKKTENDLKFYSQHFKIPENIRILNYELLSRTRGQQEFVDYCPDLIIADEAHKLKNAKAACTRRVQRHMKAFPQTKFVAVSGTMTSKSVMDYAHILRWCLKDMAPIPTGWMETKEWSLALDEKIPFEWERLKPGALLLLGNIEPNQSLLQQGRNAFRDRLIKTPAVVATSESKLGTSLLIKSSLLDISASVGQNVERLRNTWETPNGLEISDAMQLYSYLKQLCDGFYYKWKTPAPKEWLEARKEWASYVRQFINNNRKGIDTEFQVAMVSKEEAVWIKWNQIKDKFIPETETIWIHNAVLDYCKGWVEKNEGLIWTEYLGFGQKLSEVTSIPFFSEGGMSGDLYIEDHKGPAIVSIQANATGKNLQKNWDKNLIVDCPASGATMEQLIGRTHRQGQPSDSVTVEIIQSCYEHWNALNQCIRDADYIFDTQQSEQKLRFADKELLDQEKIKKLAKSQPYLWKK